MYSYKKNLSTTVNYTNCEWAECKCILNNVVEIVI